MASSKKKPSPKKPAAKKKVAPKGKAKTKVKAKAKPAAPKKMKAAPKKKVVAKKPAPKKAKAKAEPTHGDAWGNASLAPKVKTPKTSNVEPSGTPPFVLHDHEGGLVSPIEESEELAERIHGGEEAVKNEDADDDTGSPRLDDREDSDSEE